VYTETNPPHPKLPPPIAVEVPTESSTHFQCGHKLTGINTSKTATKQAALICLESALTEKPGGGGITVNQQAKLEFVWSKPEGTALAVPQRLSLIIGFSR
jgi:hypothetical protein